MVSTGYGAGDRGITGVSLLESPFNNRPPLPPIFDGGIMLRNLKWWILLTWVFLLAIGIGTWGFVVKAVAK